MSATRDVVRSFKEGGCKFLQYPIKYCCLYRPNEYVVKTVNNRMRLFWERRRGAGARTFTTLLSLVLKTIDKLTINFFLLEKGGTMAPLTHPLATSLKLPLELMILSRLCD